MLAGTNCPTRMPALQAWTVRIGNLSFASLVSFAVDARKDK